jgi:hypothetical protein
MLEYLIQNAKNDDENLYFLDILIENIRGAAIPRYVFRILAKNSEKYKKGEALLINNLMMPGRAIGNTTVDFVVERLASRGWSRIPIFI